MNNNRPNPATMPAAVIKAELEEFARQRANRAPADESAVEAALTYNTGELGRLTLERINKNKKDTQ
jgi:hypothetical protein